MLSRQRTTTTQRLLQTAALVAAVCLPFLLTTQSLRASPLLYTKGHMDLAMKFQGGVFTGWWKNDGATVNGQVTFVDYPAASVWATGLFDETNTPLRPAGSQWDFLGVAAGEPIYILPSSGIPDTVPYLGFSTEFLSDSDFEEVTISLTGFDGPSGSTFALYTSSSNIPMQFFQGQILGPGLVLEPGDHQHFNWSFSHLGFYELTFQFSGIYLLNNEEILGTATYGFWIIPEPSTGLLLLLAGGAFCLRQRIGKKRPAPASS
jgi:surface-anchored protein